MIEDYVADLMRIAVAIIELDQHEGEVTDKRQWQVNKDAYDSLVAQFNKQRDEFIDTLLEDESSHDTAVNDLEVHIADLRERADPSWYPAIDYTQNNVLPELRKQARRSPKLRKALKRAPWVAGALVVVAYFAVRLFSGVSVDAEIATKEGLQQRAAAVAKAIRYDDWMATHVRRGGMFKGLLLWPIEPNAAELKGAAEFVGLVIEGQQYASGCGSVRPYGTHLTDDQIKIIGEVADYVRSDKVVWEQPPVTAIVKGLEHATAC
ncbi:MAG: hypothetical protein ABI626_07055 [Sphingomicrobium sp.]